MEMTKIEQLSGLNASTAEPTIITFAVSDPEVLQALAEFQEGAARTSFLVMALKVGVLSLKAARGTIDSDAVRRESDRLIDTLGERLTAWRSTFEERITGSLEHYFDPTSGTFTDRVNRLTRADGELSTVMKQQVKDAESNLTKVFDQFIGENSSLLKALDPSGDNQLIVALNRTLDEVIKSQNAAILGQFTLDNKESALSRFLAEISIKHGDLNQALSNDMKAVVAEFSLDKEDSALSRLVARVESAQRSLTSELSLDNEASALKRMYRMLEEHQANVLRNQSELASKLDAAVQALQAKREEAAKGTRHGLEFEAALAEHLRGRVAAAGDVLQEVGAKTGLIPNCKVGDHVVTLGPDKTAAGACIVLEAKESTAYDLTKTLQEADLARRNRGAGVCVFVHSVKTADASIPNFARYGHDLVVTWDAESGSSDVWLDAAMMVAAALCSKAVVRGTQESASFQRIDKAIERIRKHIDGFEEIKTSTDTASKALVKLSNRARLMEEGLESEILSIIEEFARVKQASSDE